MLLAPHVTHGQMRTTPHDAHVPVHGFYGKSQIPQQSDVNPAKRVARRRALEAVLPANLTHACGTATMTCRGKEVMAVRRPDLDLGDYLHMQLWLVGPVPVIPPYLCLLVLCS